MDSEHSSNNNNNNSRPLNAQEKRDRDNETFTSLMAEVNKKLSTLNSEFGISFALFAAKHYTADEGAKGAPIAIAGASMLEFRPTEGIEPESAWGFCNGLNNSTTESTSKIFTTIMASRNQRRVVHK